MFAPKVEKRWSETALVALVISLVVSITLALIDGLIKAYYVEHMRDNPALTMLSTWTVDLRYVAEQVLVAGAVLFVGAKFIETRTVLAIGFDKLSASRISLMGPDENNIVWIGHRYGTKLEAEAISAALRERLKESASAEAMA